MARSTFIARMIGAATLEIATYEEVEHDTDATMQAAGVVALSAIAQAFGSGYGGVIGGIVGALLGWAVLAGLTYFVGTKLFSGTATWGELLRTLGFATSPGILAVLGMIPLVGPLILSVVFFWLIVAAVVAIRQALDITTGQALVTAVLGWLAWMLLRFLVPGF